MVMLAAGVRKVLKDVEGNKTVKFDQGIYKVPDKAHIRKDGGEEWVFCEAHADPDNDKETYALIGGQRVPLAVDPNLSDDD